MASAEKRGKQWRVRYKLPNGTWGSESGFPTKSAALARGRDLESDVRHGRFVDPRRAQTPFGEWSKIWMDAQNVAPGTTAKRRRLLSALLLPEWEHTPLCDITLFAAKSWAAKNTTHAPVTVQHALTLLSMILTGAADAGYILGNPLFRRTRTTGRAHHQHKEEAVWAQPDKAVEIADRLGDCRGLMVLTACWTGLRWGELAGLHRSNCLLVRSDTVGKKRIMRHVLRIDPKVGSLQEVEYELTEEERESWAKAEEERLAAAISAGKSPKRRKTPDHRVELYVGPPKTVTSARDVDLPPFLVDLLGQHLASWPHDYVFATPTNGAFWRRGNFGRLALRPAADGRLAIEPKTKYRGRDAWEPILPGFTMRGARHTHDTWLKEDRVDRALRFQRMGWAVQDIEGTYEHVTPEMRREMLEKLQARWDRVRSGESSPLKLVSGS